MTESFDADRLDAWLEGNPFPSASLNGHSDTQADLVGTAQRFHAGIGAAEGGLSVPTRAIWEDVMQRTADLTISPPVIAATNGNGASRPPISPRNSGMEPPHRRGYWFATGSLIVIAILAITAVAYLANRPSNGGDEVPGLGISTFTPAAGSSVVASPAADDPAAIPFTILDPETIDCSEIVRRSNEEITALQADPGEFPDRSYGPAVLADAESASLVSVTDQYVNACRSEWRTLASPRLIADVQTTGYPAGLFPSYYLGQGMTMEELPAFLQSLIGETGVTDPNDLILPVDAFGEEASWSMLIDPRFARLFPDGRIGAPQSYLVHSSEIDTDRVAIVSQFVFYIQDPTQDGKWVLDESLPICVGECDDYWAAMAEGTLYGSIDQITPATPEASLSSTPEGIADWLATASAYACPVATPGVSQTPSSRSWPTDLVIEPDSYLPFAAPSATDRDSLSDVLLQIQANCGVRLPVSPDFAWMPGPPLAVPSDDQIAAAKEISAGLPNQDPASYYLVVPSDEIAANQGEGLLLPSDAVQLADGRLGVPGRFAWSSEDDLQAGARTEMAKWTGDDNYAITSFFTFERSGDTWLIDEMFMGCVGECDRYWELMTDEEFIASFGDATFEDESQWLNERDPGSCLEADTSGWLTAQTVPVTGTIDLYLPYGPASPSDAIAVAQSFVDEHANCDPADVGYDYLGDIIAMFPGEGMRATSDEIEVAKQIAAAVAESPYDLAIDGGKMSDDTMLDYPAWLSRGVVLPSAVVTLPDGRFGVPEHQVLTTSSTQSALQVIDDSGFLFTAFRVYSVTDGHATLEEVINVCIGKCDDYWESIHIVEATPVASPDIDRWLIPPSSVDCGTPVDNDLNSNEWSTDLVIDTDAYLPFSMPPTDQQESIADTALLIMSDCVNTTMISPDFAWMPGYLPDFRPTTAQIAAAQEISAALPDQAPANYFIVRPSDDPDYRGRTVLLPDDVVMLADGRLGAPYRYFATMQGDANWTRSQMGGGTFAMVPFLAFERSGDTWLLDEMFMVCVGECEQAWQAMANGTNLDGTPEPLTISAASFDAITADDCPPVPTGFAGPFNAPRYDTGENPYVVTGLPGVDILGNVTDSVRKWRGCALAASEQSQQAFQTNAFTENGGTTKDPLFGEIADPVERANRATGFQVTHRDLADAMLTGDWDDFNVPVEYAAADYVGLTPMGNRAVVLADARIAVPLMTVWPQSAWASMGDESYWFVPVDVLIWSTEANRWLVDESFQLCAGDCDQFLVDVNTFGTATPPVLTPVASPLSGEDLPPSPGATSVDPGFILPPPDSTYTDDGFKHQHPEGTPGVESTSVVVLPPVSGTPASPLATPDSTSAAAQESAWLINPESISCNRANGDWTGTNAIGIPGTLDDYVPFGPASAETQVEVARTYQLISGLCFGHLDQEEYITDTYWRFPLRPDNLPVTQDQLDIVRAISESINTGDAMDFIHATDAAVELPEPFVSHFALLPSTVIELPDGRLGAPLQIVVEANSPDDLEPWIAETGGLVVSRFVVFVPADDGYVMEATIPICVGECEDYWSGYVIADTAPMSTPESIASSQTDLAYEPITAEECNVESLATDEVSAIIRDPGEEPDRSYVPVGPADPADAEAAIAADRAWQSCSAYGSIGQRTVLQTPWLTATGPDPDLNWLPSNEIESMVTERQALSDAMLSNDPFDYLISSGQTQEEMITNLAAPSFTIPASSGAFEIEDGRIAIPQIGILAEDSYQFTDDWSPSFDYFTLPVHIMAQDPSTGDWLVDEVTRLCAGDCDQLIANVQAYEDQYLEQSDQEPATPEATPAAGS